MQSHQICKRLWRVAAAVAILSLLGWCLTAAGAAAEDIYPTWPGTKPAPMNPQDQPNLYYYKYSGYNLDGTLTANPVIAATAPLDVKARFPRYPDFVFKKLTSGDQIAITNPAIAPPGSYTVYSAIPVNMTLAGAYQSTKQYYPTVPTPSDTPDQPFWHLWNDLFFSGGWPIEIEGEAPDSPTNTQTLPGFVADYGTKLNNHRVAPDTLNGGNPYDLHGLTATGSNATDDQVKVVASGYYLPYVTDSSAGTHNEITGNVAWTIDFRMNSRASFPWGDAYHMLPYGWALDPKTCNQALTIHNLQKNGGADRTVDPFKATSTLAEAAQPFNFWLKLIGHQKCQYKSVVGVNVYFPAGIYSDLVLGHIQQMIDDNSVGYPFPKPDWLANGAFMPLQPQPGFQRNLIRWYTAWGAFNLLNNTSDLFVRNNGDVEIPLRPDGHAIPLVSQTWTDQKYLIFNKTDQPIPSTTDTYPGEELYLTGNTYFPNLPGIMNCYKQYMIWDLTSFQSHKLTARVPDNWLGLKGDTPVEVMDWADANGTEPGGQANKPYMYSVMVDEINQISIMFESANSVPVAKQSASSVAQKLYAAKLYVDNGAGYQLLAVFDCRWRAQVLNNESGRPVWQASGPDKLGAVVPEITFVDHTYLQQLNLGLKAFKALSWNSAARGEIAFDTGSAYQSQKNTVATKDYYQYQLSGTLASSGARLLVVLENHPKNLAPILLNLLGAN